MNHRPAADCAPRRRRRHHQGRLLVDLMHFVHLHQRIFGKVFSVVVVVAKKHFTIKTKLQLLPACL